MFKFMLAAAISMSLLAGCSYIEGDVKVSESGSVGFDYSSVADAQIRGADIVFTEMMVLHHAQALVLAELAYRFAEDDRVISLAREIEATQDAEIDLMNSWLANSGTEKKNQTHGEMKGMLSDEDFERLEGLRGNEFDVAWLEYMIEHHDGAVIMVEITRFSDTEEVILFGEHIVAVQSEEIRLMENILAKIR